MTEMGGKEKKKKSNPLSEWGDSKRKKEKRPMPFPPTGLRVTRGKKKMGE